MDDDSIKSTSYCIVLRGELGDDFQLLFEGLRLGRTDGVTTLTGPLDQAQLGGVISRVQDLGIELVSIEPADISHRDERTQTMEQNLVLYAASYPDPDTAALDLKALKEAQSADEFEIVGAVVVNRDADGKIDVKESGATATAGGATIGGIGGLVIGLFAPPLLLSTAVGAAIGAGIGWLVKRHEEKEIGMELDDVVPPSSSGIIVLADDLYADRIEKALGKATKKVSKAIDSGDADKLSKALSDAGYDVSKAVTS
jgi:uncharacterized membrane protein